MRQEPSSEQETIIRFSSAWWGYLFCRLGLLRAVVNGVEDALAILGRFLLLVFLLYCGAQAGILLSDPTFSFPPWLEMTMFCLQLAGLEGSIPGLARQVEGLRSRNEQEAASKVEAVMLSARVMTVLSIGEGALHALHVPPAALQLISACLLIVRGIVITGFLMVLANVERPAPRILSREAHQREQQAQQDEQARTQEQMEQLAHQLAQMESTFQQRLAYERTAVQESLQQLATELASIQESLHTTHAELASLQEVQAEAQERREPEQRVVLRAVPRREQQGEQDKFDARAFVFACLQENPTAKLAELANRARTICKVELSQSTMSRYRKQYFARSASPDASSALQGASPDASRVAST
ncbi:MAG: hypothetical protein JO202_11635 [Ktedonobacteraceae bacterium]|nr:hypothetical protein [Ktedonobacteraceae bacterium]